MGRVVAVFARSACVEVGRDLICVGSPELRRGPLNALVTSASALRAWLAGATPGQRVTCTSRRIRLLGAELDFDGARRWHPPRPALPVDGERLLRGIAAMRAAAAGRVPDDGLAFLVGGTSACANRLALIGDEAANMLHDWLVQGDLSRIPQVLENLIGLGPGLTPSGDDFLGGALVALHAFGRSDAAHALAGRVLPLCERGTHPVSAAHLRAAARGEGGEALHACLCALAEAQGAERCVDAIATTGHTSGWDALGGALVVAAAHARPNRTRGA